tara:strand:+ start:1091 stop:1501 length:411 start_codon:yes stop_codon:yes gene_type:complete
LEKNSLNLIKKILFLVIITFSFCVSSKELECQGVIIRILNKITTEKFLYVVPLSQTLELTNAKIVIYKCFKLEDDSGDDEIALITHKLETYRNEDDFFGWIFKSSQYLNTPVNPIYDIKLQECLIDDPIFLKKVPI